MKSLYFLIPFTLGLYLAIAGGGWGFLCLILFWGVAFSNLGAEV